MEFERSLTFSQTPDSGLNSEQYHSNSHSLTLCTYFLWKEVLASECVEWMVWVVGARESGFNSRDGHDRLFVLQNDPTDYGFQKSLPGVKQIKNAWNSICIPPYISMILRHIKHSDSSCSVRQSTSWHVPLIAFVSQSDAPYSCQSTVRYLWISQKAARLVSASRTGVRKNKTVLNW